MSTQEDERPFTSIAQAALDKIVGANEPKAEEEEPTPEEPEPPPTEEEAAEEAADQAEADLPDDATPEEVDEARQAALDEFYAGTYKTREEAEKGIAEKDATLDRLYSEKNYLQQRLQQQEEARQQEAQEEQELDRPAWDEWAADAVEQGAGPQGALDALTEGGYEGYQIYLRHWLASDDDSDRAQATLFNNEVMLSMAEARAQAAASYAAAQPSAREEDEQATAMVKARRTDFDQHVERMQAVAENLHPADAQYLRYLATQGAQGKARALDILYLEARTQGPVSTPAQQAERQRRKVSGDAARLAATSLSAEGTPSRTPPPGIEQEGLRRKAEFRARMNLPPLEGE